MTLARKDQSAGVRNPVDDATSSIYIYAGAFSEDNKPILSGSSVVQGKEVKERLTFVLPDPSTFILLIENDMSGGMKKAVEETAKRSKSGR